MITVLIALALVLLAFYVTGAFSLVFENKLTEFFEYFLERNGVIITGLGAVNALLLSFFSTTFIVAEWQTLILLAYVVVSLVSKGFTIYVYNKAGE